MTQHMNVTVGSVLLTGLLAALLGTPGGADASSASAALGGGNALMRALESRSLGITNANPVSDILSRLQFASTNGGTENTGGGQSQDEQQEGSNGNSGSSAGEGGGNGQNGGAQGGNGGDGGPGGVVRAGNTVTNSNALNILNTLLIRFNLGV